MAKKIFLCSLIFFLFTPRVFSWQITSYRQSGDFSIKEKSRTNLNIVFVSLGYQENDEFRKDISSIIGLLKNTPPFKEFKGIEIYLLDAAIKEKTLFFKKSESFPFLKIRDALIQGIKNHIGGVYKLVILNKEGALSAAELSSIRGISVIILGRNSYGKKNRLARAFLHELGHSLGLKEESAGGSQYPLISGEPNCAPDEETAAKWWGDMVKEKSGIGYFKIQSGGSKFIKPTRGSIMNNPFKSSGYGPVNERYLRRELGLV